MSVSLLTELLSGANIEHGGPTIEVGGKADELGKMGAEKVERGADKSEKSSPFFTPSNTTLVSQHSGAKPQGSVGSNADSAWLGKRWSLGLVRLPSKKKT